MELGEIKKTQIFFYPRRSSFVRNMNGTKAKKIEENITREITEQGTKPRTQRHGINND